MSNPGKHALWILAAGIVCIAAVLCFPALLGNDGPSRPVPASDSDTDTGMSVLEFLAGYTMADWESLSTEELNSLFADIQAVAVGNEQKQRDMYIMRGLLNTDGAFTEFLSSVTANQYQTDEAAWEEALSEFSLEEALFLRQMLAFAQSLGK